MNETCMNWRFSRNWNNYLLKFLPASGLTSAQQGFVRYVMNEYTTRFELLHQRSKQFLDEIPCCEEANEISSARICTLQNRYSPASIKLVRKSCKPIKTPSHLHVEMRNSGLLLLTGCALIIIVSSALCRVSGVVSRKWLFKGSLRKLAQCEMNDTDKFYVEISSWQGSEFVPIFEKSIAATTSCCDPAVRWFQTFSLSGDFHVPDLHKAGYYKVKLYRPSFQPAHPGYVQMGGGPSGAFIKSCTAHQAQYCRTCPHGKIASELYSHSKNGYHWYGGMNIECGLNLAGLEWPTYRRGSIDSGSQECESEWEPLHC